MTWIDAVGFAAGALTLGAFAQKSMRPMRTMAIAANLCFIAHGIGADQMPVLALHAILLPLNIQRLLGAVPASGSDAERRGLEQVPGRGVVPQSPSNSAVDR